MHEDGVKLLNLMFRPGETVCVSPNKYGFHSLPVESVTTPGMVTLVSPRSGSEHIYVPSKDLTMVALNPISGFRRDENCIAYRNFLVEMDHGDEKSQREYVDTIGMPWGAVVFSGGKSLHFLISLSEDLPSENVYRKLSEWILGVASLADQNTKNPSRSIRIPGAEREPGKFQRLVDFRGPISPQQLLAWLKRYPDCRPKEREIKPVSDTQNNYDRIAMWAQRALRDGLDPTKGRNSQWFAIACEYCLAGFSQSDTIGLLSNFFRPDKDFSEKEWLTTLDSAFKHIYDRGR